MEYICIVISLFMNTYTEENYLKAIYNLSVKESEEVSTNSIAEKLSTKASSVTDMMKKLADKKYVSYQKYQGAVLTTAGQKVAIEVVRKHRLWEVFLVEKLNFKWDEVHEIAEQLEHINSSELINRLEEFLGFPEFDPHGDPIPDKNGNMKNYKKLLIADLKQGKTAVLAGVKDSSSHFLQYLESVGLALGTKIRVLNIFEFDKSVSILVNGKKEISISNQVSENLYVMEVK